MKILFLSRSLHIGGSERQLTVLAKGLRARGHEVKVAVFYQGGQFESDLKMANIPIIYLKKRNRWDVLGFFGQLVRIIKIERPDILHGYLAIPNILTIMVRPFRKEMKIIWGIRASQVDLFKYDILSRLAYYIERKLSHFPNLIICNSYSGIKNAAQRGFPRLKMCVVRNGIDTTYFYPDLEARRKTRREWSIPEGIKVIGLVARLDPMKDHVTFIKAAARLDATRSDVRFVCVGNGPDSIKSKLDSLTHEYGLDGKMIWARDREDIRSIYNSFDIIVSSSCGEGFPNVIAEGMACGIPCVVTDVGDSAQIVGNNGIVVPPHNPAAMAKAIDQMLKSLKPAKNDLHEYIQNNFSNDVLIKETEKLLLTISVENNFEN